MKNTAVSWDFHGVLEKNNEWAVRDTLNTVLKENGLTARANVDFVRQHYGISWRDFYKILLLQVNEETLDHLVKRSNDIGLNHSRRYIKPREHAHDVLYEILRSGGKNLLLSNTQPDKLEAFVNMVGLGGLFTEVHGGESHNDIVKYKASKIRDFCEHYRLSRVFVVDDSPLGVAYGKLVGAEIYHFLSHNRTKHPQAHHGITDLRQVLQQ
jgi:phosphoglycolate phosphatase-like HAD superfamily hydrolase